jgi:uncharacterized DUF497 family protein
LYYGIFVEDRRIVWDENKNIENKRKHKATFEVAQYVFTDPERIWRLDRSEHNVSGEERWQTIGKVGKLFFVVYTEQETLGVHERALSQRGSRQAPLDGVGLFYNKWISYSYSIYYLPII